MWAGFKYTIFLVLIVLILFIAGFFITGSQPNDGTDVNKYIRVCSPSARFVFLSAYAHAGSLRAGLAVERERD